MTPANTIVAQKISQGSGVGQVTVVGSSQPAVRAELNPLLLSKLGLGLDQVRAALGAANADVPKGALSDAKRMYVLNNNDQLFLAKEYAPLIIAYRNGAPVRLSDVATVVDSQEDIRNAGLVNDKPAVDVELYRQPDANIIDVVDRVQALMPVLQASVPTSIHLDVAEVRTTMIRASVHDVEVTLAISVLLVIFVVFCFLRSLWATAIPSVAVPLSLVGTFGVMYLCHYSIDNLSLMALTISTGFVVDDAIVVIENISRYLDQGLSPTDAALRGSREIGFTVLSMSSSLIAVFIPILLMGGILGRIFREFAVTLSVAVALSMVISLTTTPMMCAQFLRAEKNRKRNWLHRASERAFQGRFMTDTRGVSAGVLRHQPLVLRNHHGHRSAWPSTSTWPFPKDSFRSRTPAASTVTLTPSKTSRFARTSMWPKVQQYVKIIESDPAVRIVWPPPEPRTRPYLSITLKPSSRNARSAWPT